MRTFIFRRFLAISLSIALLPCARSIWASEPSGSAVALSDDADAYTLANGILSARIDKNSGGLLRLDYRNLNLLNGDGARASGYWSHAPSGDGTTASCTIDPASNAGDRAEISIKRLSRGKPQGHGPGGSAILDIEIRYAIERGSSGLYTYCIFKHDPSYPATAIGEARFALKLNPKIFDWMTIDERRNKMMPTGADWDAGTQLNMKEARRLTTGIDAGQVEHKYDYSAVQFDTPAFGWSSTKERIGLWLVNPSAEYLSGGATKVELTGHLDNNKGGAPTLLNYWRGSHYGGSHCEIAAGEAWTKVVGPFLIECNAGPTPQEMWKEALATAATESAKWPYEWVNGVDYPHRRERGAVSGQIVLYDPQYPREKMSNLRVGLAWPNEPSQAQGRDAPIGGTIDWQQDAKHYEFWTRGAHDGTFSIANVRPGTYILHAIADGVLGESSSAPIAVQAGQSLSLGKIDWRPQRFGRQIWEIGIPDRTAGEFLHGDHYWQWGLYNAYATDFPTDVNFIIGKSDFHKDWNYAQVPRNGKSTTWIIRFDLAQPPVGHVVLRLAIAGNSARRIDVTVNDRPAGTTGPLPDTAVVRRDGIRGYWFERDVTFDANLLKAGGNALGLTIPGANAYAGVEYDYLRLEERP